MFQPEPLRTTGHVAWAWGTGENVWALFQAAMSGDIARLEALLHDEPGLIRASYGYRNALHFAVRENQVEAAKLLLRYGSDITFTGERWHTGAPQLARDRENTEMQKLLADHQFEHFQICPAGDDVAAAIRSREPDRIRAALAKHGPHVADDRGNQGLHWAVMTRQMPVVEMYLLAGADIESMRPDGAKPIHLTNGDYWYRGWRDHGTNEGPANHWSLVGFLLAKGAEYDLVTACRLGDLERVRAIVQADPAAANRDVPYCTWYLGFPLRSAAKAGHREIVEYLLDQGADPNKPEHGLCPFGGCLFDAAQNGHYEVVQLLLERGANPNQVVESSGSPLSIAGDERITRLLLEYGAKHDWFGCVYSGHVEQFDWHCQQDASLASDSELFTLAVDQDDHAMIEVFERYDPTVWTRMQARLGKTAEATQGRLERGMQVDQANWLGIHALHQDFEVAQLASWVDLGVNLNLIDSEHQSTPLAHAVRRGNGDQAKALLDAGADPQRAGAEWARPVEWAKRLGLEEQMKFLAKA